MAASDADWEIVSSTDSPVSDARRDDLQALEEAMADVYMNRGYFAVGQSSDGEEAENNEGVRGSIAMEEQEQRMNEDDYDGYDDDDDDDDDDGMHGIHAPMHAPSWSSPHAAHAMEEQNEEEDGSMRNPGTEENSSNYMNASDDSSHGMDETEAEEGASHGVNVDIRSLMKRCFACASWFLGRISGNWRVQLGFANTVWSLAMAAAVMGIVILGCGWRRFHYRNQKLRALISAKDKKLSQLMFQLLQMKDLLSRSRRIPIMLTKNPALPTSILV